MKTITKKINVTKTGIKRGKSSYSKCPVARAFKCVGIKDPWVNSIKLMGSYKNFQFEVPTPKAISKWIKRYDLCGIGNPISFNLKFSV